jgi:hypothetical protein
LSLIITRIVTVALQLTGLSPENARFQSRSAFTGTGFTTEESEQIVNHPVRRRIIMWLMVIRNAGLITIVISLILSFASLAEEQQRLFRLAWLLGGITLLWLLANCKAVDRCITPPIEWALRRWTRLNVQDYVSLLNLSGDYEVTQIQVQAGEWAAGKTLAEMDLPNEGILLLGIIRHDDDYVGAPRGSTMVYPRDTLILYGRTEVLRELEERRADFSGEQAHQQAVNQQQIHLAEQDRQEQKRDAKRQDR